MAEAQELLDKIGDRLVDALEHGATSDTVLKLAEAWAWVARPDQPHGGFSAG